ncbi:hypothetical protein CCHR01_15494 [Colletotrichum chrysophilum]|uniref:Secreted protein n=1 Tax=Colletotrichum chrysophilum TaxID=1836956 RepID=A0AAD9A6J7_9PEZI|nr:hypothetical protein CCHR01_15494 [Colletotrichum chrysophilum]
MVPTLFLLLVVDATVSTMSCQKSTLAGNLLRPSRTGKRHSSADVKVPSSFPICSPSNVALACAMAFLQNVTSPYRFSRYGQVSIAARLLVGPKPLEEPTIPALTGSISGIASKIDGQQVQSKHLGILRSRNVADRPTAPFSSSLLTINGTPISPAAVPTPNFLGVMSPASRTFRFLAKATHCSPREQCLFARNAPLILRTHHITIAL